MMNTTLLAMAGAALLFASCNGPVQTDARSDSAPAPAGPAAVAPDGDPAPAFTGFGLRLFQEVQRARPGENIFLSPASVAFALAMTHGGADGATRDAIARALGVSPAEVGRSAAALRGALASDREDVRIRVANSLWARDGVPFRPEFLRQTRADFGAEVATLDFGAPGAVARINGWVSEHTEGRIPSIVDRIDAREVLFLVNAVHFHGRWTHRFDPRATRPGDFALADGRRVQHPMMSQTGQFATLTGEGWQAVRLPYGEDGRLAMYLFVPEEGRSLADFYRQLDAAAWEGWMPGFREERVQVTLPRFRMEFQAALRPALEGMGMGVAFDPDRADFGGMLPREFLDRNNAYITRVQHRTWVEVDEAGTEAAGATSVAIGIVSMPPQFTADRPFFVAIRDGRTGEVLFAGQVMDPR
jgi:serine protease inhibitor